MDENSAARIGVLLGAHEIMSGRVLQVNYTAPRTTSVKLTETANIEVEKENEDDPDKVEISCEYNKFIKTASAQILGSLLPGRMWQPDGLLPRKPSLPKRILKTPGQE